VKEILRRYWREIGSIALWMVPLLLLLPLGLVFLWQQGWIVWWSAVLVVLGGCGFLLRRRSPAGGSAEGYASAGASTLEGTPSADWGPKEVRAWQLVTDQARSAPPLTLTDRDEAWRLVLETLDMVARFYHPDAPDARWRLTLPEGLLLAERVARDLRGASLRYIPGVGTIRISTLLKGQELYEAYGDAGRTVLKTTRWARRGIGLAVNPLNLLVTELGNLLTGKLGAAAWERIRADLTRLLVEESGRAAIDLYAGRLRLTPEELAARAEPVVPPKPEAVQVLITGQVNAGKSSLLNALTGEAHRRTGITPSRDSAGSVPVERPEKPPLLLTDLPGLGHDGRGEAALQAQADRADMIVWVVSATDPGREADLKQWRALRAGWAADPDRRPPVLLLAVTHIDLLPPRREWLPPYDLADAARPKSAAIVRLMEELALLFDLPVGQIVPLSLRAGQPAYNADLVWALVDAHQSEARHHLLDRRHAESGEFSFSDELSRLASAGRWMWNSVRRGL
jgi:predicted GTPase